MSQLTRFLNSYTKDTSKVQTHLNLNGGKYNIPENQLNSFYKIYYDEIIKNNNEISLSEKISEHFAYFQDIDSKGKTINDDDIMKLIATSIKLMKEWFDVDQINYIVSKRMSNYHINYYDIVVTSETAILFTKEIVEKEEMFKDYIDTSVYKTGLRLLGSSKGKQSNQNDEEKFYKIYDLNTGIYTNNVPYEIFKLTLIRRGTDTELLKIKKEITNSNENVQKPVGKISVTQSIMIELTKLFELLKETNESVKDFDLTPVKAKYQSNRSGMCYYVETNNRFCPFKHRDHARISNPMYVELSKKGLAVRCYDKDCVKEVYPATNVELPNEEIMKKDYPFLHKTLYIKQWTNEIEIDPKTQEILEHGLSGTHYRLAKVLYHIYKDTFRVDEPKNSDWYEFDGVRWKKSFQMFLNVSESIPKYYKALKNAYNSMNDDDQQSDNAKSFNQCLDSVIKKLENVSFKNSVLQDAKYMFLSKDQDFARKLDSNPMLLGFENGVYDLDNMEFRNGKQSDYITFSTGYDYVEYDENNEITKEIYGFIEKIITNKEVREYTLKVLGKSLVGMSDEKFYIWTGLSGANGKSTLVNFLEMALGDYAGVQDVALLTNKRPNSNAATPEVVEMRGKRMIFFQEPEGQDKLRTGILKQYTGGDTIKARELFKAPISFKCQAAFVMCCNDLPPVTSLDGGTWRRIRVTEFKSRFCENPKKQNEFKIDHNLKFKLKSWKPYFMSILIHYYKKFIEEGLVEPSEVCEATTKYKTENDKYNDYFEEYLVEDESSFVSNNQLYESFKDWWLNNYSYNSLPSIEEFRKSMRKKYGEEKLLNKQKGFNVSIRFDSISSVVNQVDELE